MLCLALPPCCKVRKMDFQSQFSMSKIIRILLNFFLKLAILTDYKYFRMLCLALPPCQKLGMILPFKAVLKLKLPKNHFNKKYAPKLLFFIKKKV